MATKTKRKKMVSPAAKCLWPKLNRPDTKYKAEGEYSVKLRFDPKNNPGHKKFLGRVSELEKQQHKDAAAEINKKKVKHADSIIKPVEDDEGEETGLYDIKFGLKAEVKNKATGEVFKKKPTLFDGQRNVLPASVQIGHGSTLKIATTINPWYSAALGAGVSLWLDAVMVLELKEPGEASAGNYFGDEDEYGDGEGSFVYKDEAEDTFPSGDQEEGEDVAEATEDDTPDF